MSSSKTLHPDLMQVLDQTFIKLASLILLEPWFRDWVKRGKYLVICFLPDLLAGRDDQALVIKSQNPLDIEPILDQLFGEVFFVE